MPSSRNDFDSLIESPKWHEKWDHIFLKPIGEATRGSLRVVEGKSKYAKRTLSLTEKARSILLAQRLESKSDYVLSAKIRSRPFPGTRLRSNTQCCARICGFPRTLSYIHSGILPEPTGSLWRGCLHYHAHSWTLIHYNQSEV